MWICHACGRRTEDSQPRCVECRAPRRKAQRIKSRDLEEVWTPEQIAEWERIIKRRKVLGLIVLALFVVLAILLYLFVFSYSMGWPRPDGLFNLGPTRSDVGSFKLERLHFLG
jgi:uncharacterized membrane protein YvbJ